ncbi:hypothetical protein [Streptomyces sp. TRM68416]|uniref:hypothetical protein n=1 Tax=Streptomyces sp. TRM68416 TaxID=2758412 RepID=UPI001661C785|nr:hypothetical protein [Streptomyces sp. TRM68416]MBD0844262.1 hypothetical protein [Streptomyces sp. TRM68416]
MGLKIRIRARRRMLTLEAGRLSPRPQSPEGVALAPHTAELAALLTSGLGTSVRLSRVAALSATAVHVVDRDGDVLCNYGIAPRDEDGPPSCPITVALVKDDPDQPIDLYLEPVPGTPVTYEGNLALFPAEAAARLTRHYAPALTAPASRP